MCMCVYVYVIVHTHTYIYIYIRITDITIWFVRTNWDQRTKKTELKAKEMMASILHIVYTIDWAK